MYWRRIEKENSEQPPNGMYRDWKPILAKEAGYRCVYCSIHESRFGGTRNYHVEHYKPKSIDRFKGLENDINNLFYSCCICNCFKGADWPADPVKNHSISSYPDPSEHNYADILDVDGNTGELGSDYVAGQYLINKLYLNRPQLILERRVDYIFMKLCEYREFFEESANRLENMNDGESMKLLVSMIKELSKMDRLKDMLREMRPYSEEDIKR